MEMFGIYQVSIVQEYMNDIVEGNGVGVGVVVEIYTLSRV